MKTLNLVNKDKSEIKYEISSYPDGQNQVKILGCKPMPSSNPQLRLIGDEVTIKSRLNNFKDLEVIICATQSLKLLGVTDIHLYVPYFLGSRSDRQFSEGENNYLRDVICPIINLQGYKSVTVMDPHSYVLEACLNRFKKVSNAYLVNGAYNQIYGIYEKDLKKGFDSSILVSPDAGTSKKIYKIAEEIGYKGDIITCSKDRDENGKLTKCVVPLSNTRVQPIYKDIIIIDDICDGGNTFINIAKEIKRFNVRGKIYLIVTHSIFSKGTDELLKYFDRIYTTNSYKEHNVEKVKVLNIF